MFPREFHKTRHKIIFKFSLHLSVAGKNWSRLITCRNSLTLLERYRIIITDTHVLEFSYIYMQNTLQHNQRDMIFSWEISTKKT